MILGFYYHSAFSHKNGSYCVPGYIGVFIDSIAEQVDQLYLFLEEQQDQNSQEEDYSLKGKNITMINLGYKSTFYSRILKPGKQLKIINEHIKLIDAFLVRMPTPLGPHIINSVKKNTATFALLVGNYTKGLNSLKQPLIRKIGISLLTYYYQFLQNRTLKNQFIFVNSGELLKDNAQISKQITLIKTTTLSKESFYQREDTCTNNVFKILFTGRINFQKGLRELIDAIATLQPKYNIELHIVGWEEPSSFNYQQQLQQLSDNLGINSKVFFHGKKKIGPELDAFYRLADIYVIPSYHEGFPRTIWEAMANSVPVIATNVGSIPYYLEHKKNAIIIEPKNSIEIANAIELIINDTELRKRLIKNAYLYSKEVTLEHQSKLLIDKIKSQINEQ
ncbi:MAG: glycosyltransferase family 4 protein [Bacteroidia bacterium]|nr:glycosyltransferase family 4 protein [Bacteroidia bacterium]MBP9688326.1 glycosyltransferase family 4 protein [Bacteroidia bacterium]